METEQIKPIINKQPVFSDFISYNNIYTNNYVYNLHEQKYKLKTPYTFIQKTAIIGIELEIENLNLDVINDYSPEYYWNTVEDGSLRNEGKEFYSIPLRAKQIPYAIEYLTDYLENHSELYSFSSRCSSHIHLNVRDFTKERLFVFLLLYCLFEKHFFKIAGTKRESSIFCVPIYKTDQLQIIILRENYWKYWHKYIALNLCPIEGGDGSKRLGTIEFRHLYGTLNTKILYTWINNILHLRKASLNWNKENLLEEIKTLNTTSEYYSLYKQIFGNLCLNLTQEDFESCISHIKTALWGKIGFLKYPSCENSWMFNPDYIEKKIPLYKGNSTITNSLEPLTWTSITPSNVQAIINELHLNSTQENS